MVTGVETAGVILAILPLVVNQLEAYVQGLETIKTFRTKRYRRELESYLTRLGTQHAIFLNTLEQLLEDVAESDDEVRDLIGNPTGPSWQDAVFQARLRKRLGRDHDIYIKTTTVLSGLLQNLSDKLGLQSNSVGKTKWQDAGAIEREVKKFKDIFSKSIYAELLSRIDGANGVLQTLTQQSLHREQARSRRRTSSKPLINCRKARTQARWLHNAVVKGKCWKCPCRDKHVVNLRLDPRFIVETDHPHSHSRQFRPRFRLALCFMASSESSRSGWPWQELDTEPVEALGNDTPSSNNMSSVATSKLAVPGKKVQFAAVASALQSIPWQIVQPQFDFPAISDMCSALCGIVPQHNLPVPVGFLSADSDAGQRYNVYLIKKLSRNMRTRTLEDLLASSWIRSRPGIGHCGVIFNRRDRLFLATTLACSVLQLHGSWLKAQWRSRDIVFTEDEECKKTMLESPYISWHLPKPEDGMQVPHLKQTVSALIRSEVLFPLGLALVELSLGQTLASMREPEDNDADEAVADLKTASRLVNDVSYESGGRYGDVVKKCLFWHGLEDTNLDNEDLQQAVFESIVSPLLEDYKDFEGKSRIH